MNQIKLKRLFIQHNDITQILSSILNRIRFWQNVLPAIYHTKEFVHVILDLETNALAMNLLDNSDTTHRLKRYIILTVPDRPE